MSKVEWHIVRKRTNRVFYNKTVIIDLNFGLGEYHFFRLINPYADLIEVTTCGMVFI